MDKAQLQQIQDAAEAAARGYFKVGLNCAECVFQAFLDQGFTDLPKEVVALASGFGGGIGMTQHLCGALAGAILSANTTKGRKNPFAVEDISERIKELNGEQGLYHTFSALLQEFEKNQGCLDCRDLCAHFEDFHSKERAKNCQSIIGQAARIAVAYALDDTK